MFRSPESPGPGLRKLLKAARGSVNRFGRPLGPFLVGEASNDLMRTDALWSCQFVDQPLPPPGASTTAPLFQRNTLLNCQPPSIASTNPGAFDRNFLPCPTGSSHIELKLRMCFKSKSDTDRISLGLSALRMKAAP